MLPGLELGGSFFFFSFASAEYAFSEKSRNLSFDPEGLEQSQCQRATSHIGNLILSQKKVTNPLHNENPLLYTTVHPAPGGEARLEPSQKSKKN